MLQGQLGVRAGPPEGCETRCMVLQPAGARHDATQRLTDEDLIYTVQNLYGSVMFDSGPVPKLTSFILG